MHSSRMRTGRSLTVCCRLLPWGGLPGPGGFSLVGGVCLARGGGFYVLGGGFSLPGGVVSAWSQGGFSLVSGGFSLPGGVCLVRGEGGLPAQGGVCLVPGEALRRPPPVNRITDTCKNITLATTSLRPVNMVTSPRLKPTRINNSEGFLIVQ